MVRGDNDIVFIVTFSVRKMLYRKNFYLLEVRLLLFLSRNVNVVYFVIEAELPTATPF